MKHYLGICLVIITLAAVIFFAVHSCASAADRTVANVRDAFAKVLSLQPQVTVNQRVILTQTAPIAELAVVTKEEQVSLGFTQHIEVLSYQLPMTEKTLSVEATFRIKAGFDLRKPFKVVVDPVTHRVQATLPHATILSVEQMGDLTYRDEDSTLNRVTDSERQKLLNDLNSLAHSQAEGSTLKSDAEKQVTQRLEEIFAHNGEKLETTWGDEDAPIPKLP